MGDEMMSEKRGGSISEEDLSAVAQRYKTTTVLNLLQEVGQVQDVMIDWYAMVKHTKTGITNPREYQMLWRHLAYREPLIEEFEDDFKPLDDDSDLEYELEAFPTVSKDASAEAAAYVKVLIASDSSSESCIEKGLVMEAPLMINIPKDKSTPPPSSDESTQLASSTGGVNITVPVFVPTQVVPPVLSGETLDTTNTCQNSNFPSRRKRKPWSAQEDRSLFDAVQICGEGNWANISKGDFKGERTASQLSQRWSIIKKRHTNSNMKTGPQLSEVQLAARHALNMALDKPGGATFSNKPVQPTMAEPPSAATLRQNQSQADPKRLFPRPLASGPDAVKAAAVAAGARIATQSAAAVILKAQLKSAIHINKMGNGTSRPPVARMGGPRERYSSISPHGPRPNLGSGHGNSNVGPVVQTTGPHGGLQVKPSGPPSPVESVKEEQVVVSESLQKMNLESDLKDQEEKVVPTCLSCFPSRLETLLIIPYYRRRRTTESMVFAPSPFRSTSSATHSIQSPKLLSTIDHRLIFSVSFDSLNKRRSAAMEVLCCASQPKNMAAPPKEAKLWGGRFEEGVTDAVERFTESISFDKVLYKHDIMGSRAHASMLAKQGLISFSDRDSILEGLDQIQARIERGEFEWRTDREDVHMNIEAALTDLIGEPAKKLHTARSRNDQVSTDFRLWCRDAIDMIVARIKHFQIAMVKLAKTNEGVIVPGYTHLQRAQPVLLQHHLLAYVEQLDRDAGRLLDCRVRLNFCPLGACALAGTGLPIDRFMTSDALGFTAPMRNSMDAVSDRDFVLELLSANAIIAMHLSRLGEEWVLWASEEFGFITPSDSVSTGSSIMPQKKNPDPMELVRGKSARVLGDLVTLQVLCKGLPLAYNRDLQEDKEPVFDSVKTIMGMLEVSSEFANNITYNKDRINKALPAGHLDATTLADYLVHKGIPFRTSHDIVGRAVALCVYKKCELQELSLDELRTINTVFEKDVYEYLGVQNSINKFTSYGSTGSECVAAQLDFWITRLGIDQ